MLNQKISDVVRNRYTGIKPYQPSERSDNAGRRSSKAADHCGRAGLRALLTTLSAFLIKPFHLVYRREHYSILCFDLFGRTIPSPKSDEVTAIRLLTIDDAASFGELWRDQRTTKMKRFRQRMRDGYIGVGAWCGDELVGANWLAQDCDHDSLTGLCIRLAPGSCFALDLQEHKNHQHHRIGLATLAYSLYEARRRDLRYQYIAVSDRNKRMLAGAKYLMGYRQAGEITTTYWFQHARSRWKLGDLESRNKTIILGC